MILDYEWKKFIMYSFLFKLLFISSATFLFSYIFSKCAYILKLIDYPDVRKLHTGEVPQVGGIAIYLTLLIVKCKVSSK